MKKGRLKFSDDLFIIRCSFPYKIAVNFRFNSALFAEKI